MGINIYFLHRLVRGAIIIVEEVNLPNQEFPHYDMLVSWEELNGRHPNTSQCTKEVERKRTRMAAEKAQSIIEQEFRVYVRPLTLVLSFKHLDHILTSLDNDWTEVVGNLWKLRKKLARLSRILGWEGKNKRVLGTLFKAVVKAVLLLGSDT